ncbi:MAG: fluoride exporter [Fimbriimonadaceae bacterium]|nr:fluoride exporter [Fimbriimonadaceae bacterium]
MSALRASLLVFLGAGLGANARFWLGTCVAKLWGQAFPWGTLLINVSGSLLIGLIFGLYARQEIEPGWRYLLITGLLGGYTTFSAFSWETLKLIQEGKPGAALAYVAASVVVGLAACWAGFEAGKTMGGRG